jgi:hypothetical protein
MLSEESTSKKKLNRQEKNARHVSGRKKVHEVGDLQNEAGVIITSIEDLLWLKLMPG